MFKLFVFLECEQRISMNDFSEISSIGFSFHCILYKNHSEDRLLDM